MTNTTKAMMGMKTIFREMGVESDETPRQPEPLLVDHFLRFEPRDIARIIEREYLPPKPESKPYPRMHLTSVPPSCRIRK